MAKGMNHCDVAAMRRLVVIGLVLGGVLVLTPSCRGTTDSGTDSNTHWLARCSDKDDCGGLECLCGVCTRSCDNKSQCSGLVAAVCEPLARCTGSAQSTSVCTAQCSRNAECTVFGAHLTCVDGHCDSASSPDPGQAGAAGVGSTATSGGSPSGGTGHSGAGGNGGSSIVAAAGSGNASSASGGTQGEGGSSSIGGAPLAAGGNDGRSGSHGSGNSPGATGGAGGAAGSSSGGTLASGGRTGSEAGAGGTALSADRLVLDPSTLTFFLTPTGSIRYAVTGYDATQRTCATIVWEPLRAATPVLCDLLWSVGEDLTFPYVVLKTDTDGPCTDADWDYQGNVDTTSSKGCADFSLQNGTSVNMVDVEIGVEGTLFTGTIVADNRPQGMVTFGLEYMTDVPENTYVQTGGDLGLPEWLHVTRDGERVDLFEHCDVPRCGSGGGVCDTAYSRAANVTGGTESGSIYLTWDGQVWSIDEQNQCLTSAPATSGSYEVEVCYGWSTVDSGSGPVVQNPVCVTQDFTYPTDRVTVTVDNGG